MTPAAALDYIRHHNLIGLRAGRHRASFLDIWMVVVDDRIFVRSWGLAERGWYHAFLADSQGAIRCGEAMLPVRAQVPADLVDLSPRISQAYLAKYDAGANSYYAQGITRPEHVARTLELLPQPTTEPVAAP
ncbi:DUF2255 family protein [Hymenobacter sp. B81]|uniref:DUF2255 family protein n=1 Tax=Hymenobacter sp. B81 TaxID=3344878 RepID=UPI0037DD3C99